MGMLPGQIRNLVMAIIRSGDKILASRAAPNGMQQDFYRLLGGGIEFGEIGEEALKREFLEELGTELINIRPLGIVENIFTYNGQNGHEIIQLFEAEFKDPSFYKKAEMPIFDSKNNNKAYWILIDQAKNKELTLYPEEVLNYIDTN